MELLLKKGARADMPRGVSGKTVLHRAIINDDRLALDMILAHHTANLDMNVGDINGRTVLHYAAKEVDHTLPSIVLADKWKKQLKFGLRDTLNGDTPLHIAVAYKRLLATVKLLAGRMSADELNTRNNTEGCTPLMLVRDESEHSIRVLRYLCGLPGIDLNMRDNLGRTALYRAAERGNMVIMESLLEAGADPSIPSSYDPRGNLKCYRRFLEHDMEAITDSRNFLALRLRREDRSGELDETDLKEDLAGYDALINSAVTPTHSGGRFPLHLAVLSPRCEDMVSMLVDFGVDENDVDAEFGMTALRFAVALGKPDLAKMMLLVLSDRLDLNVRSKDSRRTAVHMAIHAGMSDIVDMMLKLDKLDCNLRDSEGKTALELALERGAVDLAARIASLPNMDCNLDCSTGAPLLMYAMEMRAAPVVETVIARPDTAINKFNAEGMNPLLVALDRVDMGTIALLCIRNDVDLNVRDARGMTPLLIAMRKKSVALVELFTLRSEGVCDVNAIDPLRCKTPLRIALDDNESEYIKVMLKRPDLNIGAVVPSTGRNALHSVCDRGHREYFHMLTAHETIKELVNVKDSRGRTPMAIAEMRGHVELVLEMMNLGWKPELLPVKAWATLYSAAWYGQASMLRRVMTFCNGELDVNVADASGRWTPLHAACFRGNMDCVRCLLDELGATIEPKTLLSPLDVAAMGNHFAVVDHLVSRHRFTAGVVTPLHMAILHDNYELAVFLIERRRFVNDKSPALFDYTPLHLLVSKAGSRPNSDRFEVLRALLDLDDLVDVNARDRLGRTALFRTCLLNNVDFADALLNHDLTNITMGRSFHDQAMSAAIYRSNAELVEKLLRSILVRAGATAARKHALRRLVAPSAINKMLSYAEFVKSPRCADAIRRVLEEYTEDGDVGLGLSVAWSDDEAHVTPDDDGLLRPLPAPAAPLLRINCITDRAIRAKLDELAKIQGSSEATSPTFEEETLRFLLSPATPHGGGVPPTPRPAATERTMTPASSERRKAGSFLLETRFPHERDPVNYRYIIVEKREVMLNDDEAAVHAVVSRALHNVLDTNLRIERTHAAIKLVVERAIENVVDRAYEAGVTRRIVFAEDEAAAKATADEADEWVLVPSQQPVADSQEQAPTSSSTEGSDVEIEIEAATSPTASDDADECRCSLEPERR